MMNLGIGVNLENPLAMVSTSVLGGQNLSVVTTLLLDTFTGAAGNINGTTSDNGKTRTQVTGLLQLDGSGKLIWADDGSSTIPAAMKWGSIAANGTLTASVYLIDSTSGYVYFNCDATLQNGWRCYISISDNFTSLERLDSGVPTQVDTTPFSPTTEGYYTIQIVRNGDSLTFGTPTENKTITASTYKAQSVVGAGLFSNLPFDTVQMTT